jgi:hypothetical protein
MSTKQELQRMEEELEAMQASECRRAAEREQEHQRALRRARTQVGLACGLLALLTVGVIAGLASSLGSPPAPADEPPWQDTPEAWATYTADAGVESVARPLPSAAFKGQKKPPCEKDEVALLDACWVALARKPEPDHCGSKGYEHDGKCYMPVQQAQRAPTSMEP